MILGREQAGASGNAAILPRVRNAHQTRARGISHSSGVPLPSQVVRTQPLLRAPGQTGIKDRSGRSEGKGPLQHFPGGRTDATTYLKSIGQCTAQVPRAIHLGKLNSQSCTKRMLAMYCPQ